MSGQFICICCQQPMDPTQPWIHICPAEPSIPRCPNCGLSLHNKGAISTMTHVVTERHIDPESGLTYEDKRAISGISVMCNRCYHRLDDKYAPNFAE